MTGLRIGELARLAGVKAPTLRFYERRGLLPRPPRLASGYRHYAAETADLVRFIQRAQELGFSLREVKDLLALGEAPRSTWGDAVVLVQHKLQEIEAKVNDLLAMRAALNKVLNGCTNGTAPINQLCPTAAEAVAILDRLAGERKADIGQKGSEEYARAKKPRRACRNPGAAARRRDPRRSTG